MPRSEYQRDWRRKNPDKYALIQKRKWERYEENREKYREEQCIIARIRKKHGMTQNDLAKLIGVDRRTIGHYEAGDFEAPWDKLCAALPELERYRPK